MIVEVLKFIDPQTSSDANQDGTDTLIETHAPQLALATACDGKTSQLSSDERLKIIAGMFAGHDLFCGKGFSSAKPKPVSN